MQSFFYPYPSSESDASTTMLNQGLSTYLYTTRNSQLRFNPLQQSPMHLSKVFYISPSEILHIYSRITSSIWKIITFIEAYILYYLFCSCPNPSIWKDEITFSLSFFFTNLFPSFYAMNNCNIICLILACLYHLTSQTNTSIKRKKCRKFKEEDACFISFFQLPSYEAS